MLEDHQCHLESRQVPLQPGAGDAFLLVDVQRDLLPGGSLAVPGSEAILGPVNACLGLFAALRLPVFASRDWHPKNHCSFSEQGGHLPEHCVAGTEGARFAAGLRLPANATVVSKGFRADTDAFSAFTDSDLDLHLSEVGVNRLFIAGLSPDLGVLRAVVDALGWGYWVVVVSDAIVTVDPRLGDGARTLAALQQAGVVVVHSTALAAIDHGPPVTRAKAAETPNSRVARAERPLVQQG
jgi:nicotinamidase-related amidase